MNDIPQPENRDASRDAFVPCLISTLFSKLLTMTCADRASNTKGGGGRALPLPAAVEKQLLDKEATAFAEARVGGSQAPSTERDGPAKPLLLDVET